jgi:hypothetical protein
MKVNAAFSDANLLSKIVDCHFFVPVSSEQPIGCIKDGVAGASSLNRISHMTDDQNRILVIIIDEKEVVKVSRNLLNADLADRADQPRKPAVP